VNENYARHSEYTRCVEFPICSTRSRYDTVVSAILIWTRNINTVGTPPLAPTSIRADLELWVRMPTGRISSTGIIYRVSMSGISLWLMPNSAAREPLRGVISTLSERHQSPQFEPHITLISLPAQTPTPLPSLALPKPFCVQFKSVQSGTSYFQSIRIAIEPTPALLSFHDAAVVAFHAPKKGYFPHLSLFYAELPSQGREAIIDMLKEEGVFATSSTGINVQGVGSVEITELWIVRTEGPVETWEVLEKCSFPQTK
jgi:2',3'-cyclic-nucleotide 3'-phosphodiesterase